MRAFKVVIVLDEERVASVLPGTRRIYRVHDVNLEGPFFLCRTFRAARDFAEMWKEDFAHIAIYAAKCDPIKQPKYFPCPLLANSLPALQWREIVCCDVEAADQFLVRHGINYIMPDAWVLARSFELIGEPLAELIDGEWVIHDPSVLQDELSSFLEVKSA